MPLRVVFLQMNVGLLSFPLYNQGLKFPSHPAQGGLWSVTKCNRRQNYPCGLRACLPLFFHSPLLEYIFFSTRHLQGTKRSPFTSSPPTCLDSGSQMHNHSRSRDHGVLLSVYIITILRFQMSLLEKNSPLF